MRIISNDGLIDIPYETACLIAIPMEDYFSIYNEDDTQYEIHDVKNGVFLKRVPNKDAAKYILRDIRRRYFDAVGHPKKDERLCVVNIDEYDNMIVSGKYRLSKGE